MIEISANNPEKDIVNFVRQWFGLISKGNWGEALELIDEPNCYGVVWDENVIRELIEQDTFGPGTHFATNHPEGVVYSDPSGIEMPSRDIFSLYVIEDGSGYAFEHEFPLNGEWSDLTAQFEFKKREGLFAAILHDLHVL